MVLGLIVCLAAAVLAMYLGGLQHFVGSPMIGLFLGIVIANVFSPGIIDRFKQGAGWASKYLLKAGIILAGGTLSFRAVLGVGLSALPLIAFNICLSFLAAWAIGRLMGVSPNTRVLVGGGTAICGGTAIATLTPIIKAKEHEMAYAMTAIFLFDILAAIMWPYAARWLGLSAGQYGILGGLAISDTSSVTAAGATFDAISGVKAAATVNGDVLTGGQMAIIVKLTRTVMLVFVALAVMLVSTFKKDKAGNMSASGDSSFLTRVAKAFPLFVLGFLVMTILNTVVRFSEISLGSLTLSSLLSKSYKFLITAALVGIGFKIKIKSLFTEGLKPILLGGCTWFAIALSTLAYVLIFA
ncbi:MAG: YeiH family protein [Oscillospiraceae bacterium]|jgi:uncharacterized integral membrane protein (TIGR00698 family)